YKKTPFSLFKKNRSSALTELRFFTGVLSQPVFWGWMGMGYSSFFTLYLPFSSTIKSFSNNERMPLLTLNIGKLVFCTISSTDKNSCSIDWPIFFSVGDNCTFPLPQAMFDYLLLLTLKFFRAEVEVDTFETIIFHALFRTFNCWCRRYDDTIAFLPISWCCHSVLVRRLQCFDKTNDFIHVASR